MKNKNYYVFGYGSLMNSKSLQKTLPGKKIYGKNKLLGYKRKFNIPVYGYLYLNIVPFKGGYSEGVVIEVSKEELELLKKREFEYECVEVTGNMEIPLIGKVYTFIAPDE